MAENHQRPPTHPHPATRVRSAVSRRAGRAPVADLTAHVSEFPDLTVPSPLVLTTVENGWYRLTLVGKLAGGSHTG
jgi:hypothetical protein